MKAFDFDRKLIDDYAAFSRSFTTIRSEDLKTQIDREYAQGEFWPDPLLSINPAYEQGHGVDQLSLDGVVTSQTADVFRIDGKPIRFHKHQDEAISNAKRGQSFVVTTGTGSGKSLCFFVPIVDRAIRARLAGEKARTRAIVVYPMNALANSQIKEIQKFLEQSDLPENLRPTIARYTGQESDTARRSVASNPPDILLTNYMMLELLMTRQDDLDRRVIENARGIEFIVLDELHTYRGRQGADVAILVRRLRERCRDGNDPICIGTSATMVSDDIAANAKLEVARVASRLFGSSIGPEAVIEESLRRATDPRLSLDDIRPRLASAVTQQLDKNLTDDVLFQHPLAVWTELELGIDEAKSRKRRKPETITRAAEALASASDLDPETSGKRLAEFLSVMALPEEERGGAAKNAFMAFKLHRFISGPGEIHTTLKTKPRNVYLEGQRNDPQDPEARLYPTRFCRECGQEYHSVTLVEDGEGLSVLPRDVDEEPSSERDESAVAGYLTPTEVPSDSFKFSGDAETYPEDWQEQRGGSSVLRASRRKQMPRAIEVKLDGRVGEDGESFWFLPGRFGFCLACGDQPVPQRRERNKLAGLTAEGRSSATTTIVTAMLKALNDADSGVSKEKRKTLGFTDNRQDAALQAGHFNDAVFVTLLRGAILRAILDSDVNGLSSDEFGLKVQQALGFTVENEAVRRFWMADPTIKGANRINAAQILSSVLSHRVWSDLRRGWRFTYPNLIGVELVRPVFLGLDELASDAEAISGAPRVLGDMDAESREQLLYKLLFSMIEGLAVAAGSLDPLQLDGLKERSGPMLAPPWSIDPSEELRMQAALVLVSPPRRGATRRDDLLILKAGPKSGLARALNRPSVLGQRLKEHEYLEMMEWALRSLESYGIVRQMTTAADIPGWQVLPTALRLAKGPSVEDPARSSNSFFHQLYADVAAELRSGPSTLMGMEAREHTAQVSNDQRIWRECRFRYEDDDKAKIEQDRADMVKAGEGTEFLPALFCSPTMELGVDISALNAVYLRNVPPTPANYAQRAGRAGRSGQAAVITTYCAAQSPHDQYFFRKRMEMVAGSVRPPALDLANEELVKAHLHAVWLSTSGQPLSADIPDVLDLTEDQFPIRKEIRDVMSAPDLEVRAIAPMRQIIDAITDHFDGPPPDWLEDTEDYVRRVANEAFGRFDHAFRRWRDLYASAQLQMEETQAKLRQTGLSMKDRRALEAQERAASQQVGILENGKATNGSDFYTYRYLATEGFLPGYNFPRLPLYAFVPATISNKQAAYLQRARFLAISEFGPLSLIYHEGRAYRVHKVKLPPGSVSADGQTVATGQIFICPSCGAAHTEERNKCHACDASLAGALPIRKTFRIDNVETAPAERITANDEERVRQGFDVRTVFAWPRKNGALDLTEVRLLREGETIATLQYANSADIMRLNLGLKRRADKSIMGFGINPANGRWVSADPQNGDDDTPDQAAPERIVPIVQDRKNALLIRFSEPRSWSQTALATLQHAMLRGIEVVFQLEEGEVLGEPLPSRDERQTILLYEATEGGAGVLGQIVREPGILREVMSEALSIMHYDGVDQALSAEDVTHLSNQDDAECVKGCYRCLLSYYNQPDHEVIDRTDQDALTLILALATADVAEGKVRATDDDWLDAFEEAGLKRPDGSPFSFGDTEITYVWAADYVGATTQALDEEGRAEASRKGWEIVELQEDLSKGVPASLIELLGGLA